MQFKQNTPLNSYDSTECSRLNRIELSWKVYIIWFKRWIGGRYCFNVFIIPKSFMILYYQCLEIYCLNGVCRVDGIKSQPCIKASRKILSSKFKKKIIMYQPKYVSEFCLCPQSRAFRFLYLNSLSGWTSYSKILWSLGAEIFWFNLFQSFCNLTDTSAAEQHDR